MKSEYYKDIRKYIQNGDLFLTKGSSLIAKSILYLDNAKYSHVGIVKLMGGRLWAIDMWNYGIEVVPLSRRIYSQKEFCIIRPKNKTQEEINSALEYVLSKVETNPKYDYLLLLRIAFFLKTNIPLGKLINNSKLICSELAQLYTNKLNLFCYNDIFFITPYDFIRFADESEVEILFD
jgi:hypothetical protein